MIPVLLRLAKGLYRATPSPGLRQLYFSLFLRINRGRRRIVTREGLTFDLDLGEMIDVGLYLQEYERDVAQAIDDLCQPGWTALDVGANVGAHTLRLARRVAPTGRVCAFEPTTFAHGKLVRNVALNPLLRVEVFRVALSDRDDLAGLLAARSSWRSDGARPRPAAPESVPFARLDTWCAAHGVDRVDLVKLDVDGHEFPVVAGGRRMFEASRPLVLIEAAAYHFEETSRNPFTALEALGYRFFDARTRIAFANAAALGEALAADAAAGIDSRNLVASAQEQFAWGKAGRR